MTEIKRDPRPHLPSTGCERCDADRHRRSIAQTFHKLKAEGKIVATGEMRPCGRCGKPLEVYVARAIH
jgi:hypothetical protein